MTGCDQGIRHKNIRLKDYDYSEAGYYFITIVTHQRKSLLGNIVEVGLCAHPKIVLSEVGKHVEKSLLDIAVMHKEFALDQYVIMPNHVHGIITITKEGGHRNPPLQNIVGQFKSYTTHLYNQQNSTKGLLLWQKGFYDHIIRNEHELQNIREYIQNNPLRWSQDKYYSEV